MVTYPRLIRRIKAALIDSLIISVTFMSAILLISLFEIENFYIKASALILPFFILEPMLVALTGGTIGHHIQKIRVRSASDDKNINILLALLRFSIKCTLGLLAFIFVFLTKKHQALHDKLSGSLVINNDSKSLPSHEALTDRIIEEENYLYPSKTRRIIIILSYIFLLFIILSIISSIFLSQKCIEYNKCSQLDTLFLVALNIAWLTALTLTIISGWKARLFGCKRKINDPAC